MRIFAYRYGVSSIVCADLDPIQYGRCYWRYHYLCPHHTCPSSSAAVVAPPSSPLQAGPQGPRPDPVERHVQQAEAAVVPQAGHERGDAYDVSWEYIVCM